MKNLLLMVAATLLLLPRAQAQSLAMETPAAKQQFTAYTPIAFGGYDYGDSRFTTLTKVGTVMSGVGIVSGVVGLSILISNLNVENPGENTLVTGAVLFVAGGVIGITGGCLSLGGLMQAHHRRYGFRLVTPKNNQVGIAYNF